MKLSVSSHYLGERGKDYAERRQMDRYFVAGIKMNADRFMGYLSPGDTVLDFGCGPGVLISELKGRVAAIDGLEVNPTIAAVASGVGGRAVYGGIDQIPAGTQYDAIITNHVLEHVRDVCMTLEELRSLLKPGGKLVVVVPIDDFRSAHQRGWDRNDLDHHISTWTPRLFANVLFEAGFDVMECRVLSSAWPPRWLSAFMLPGLDKALSWLTAVTRRRRQLLAVATAPKAPA